jgi:hypothetical protein
MWIILKFKKVKLFLGLSITPLRCMGEQRCNSTAHHLTPPKGTVSRYPLYRRLGGPQRQSGCYGEEKNLILLSYLAHNLVTILTALSWLHALALYTY